MRKVLTHCTRKADLLTFRYTSAQREEPINRLFSARGLPTRDWGRVIIIPRTCARIAIYACNVLKPCLHCTHNQSGSYPDWLDPDRIWIRSIHTAIFILLKHVVMLVFLSTVSCMSVAVHTAQSRWLSCNILGIRGSMKRNPACPERGPDSAHYCKSRFESHPHSDQRQLSQYLPDSTSMVQGCRFGTMEPQVVPKGLMWCQERFFWCQIICVG